MRCAVRSDKREADAAGDTHEVLGVSGISEAIDDGELLLGIQKEELGRIEDTVRVLIERRGDLRCGTEIDLAAVQLLQGELCHGAHDVMRAACADVTSLVIFLNDGPARLIGTLREHRCVGAGVQGGPQIGARRDDTRLFAVLAD